MATRKKGAGGKLIRSEVVTIRLDPRLRFSAELAARRQKRTLSSFIEWAVEKTLEQDYLGDEPMDYVATKTWDVNEADRLVKLAIYYPALLNFGEEQLWKLIRENAFFWKNVERQHEALPHLAGGELHP